jgi:hypothetical protein
LAIGAAGCARQQGPKVASSATQSSYAIAYPEELDTASTRMTAMQGVAQTTTHDFAAFPSKVKTTDAEYLERLYTLANAEGRSESYTEGFSNAQTVDSFFTREKGPLAGRIAAANEQTVEKSGCTKPDLYGATSYSLERGVTQSLEDDLKERSDAQKSITQNKRKLGERDAATLSTQVQQISMASHAVFVALPLQRSRTERLLSQASDVESTLEARSKELQQLDTKGMNYEEKKWLSDETKAVNEARAKLAQSKATAKKALDDAQARDEALQKDYDKAFDALISAARAKAKSK